MDVEVTFAVEDVQSSPEPTNALPISTIGCVSFDGLVDRPLEQVGAHAFFPFSFVPTFPQHIISPLVVSLQTSTDVIDMVHLVNNVFLCICSFKVNLR